MSAEIRIGTSGWSYKHWIGPFYPTGMPAKEMLAFYAEHFDTVELNNSFYHLPSSKTYKNWRDTVASDFVFAVKGSHFITHMKKLRDVAGPLANFFASGVLCLREKLGPILWQFPPNFSWNEGRFGKFFELL